MKDGISSLTLWEQGDFALNVGGFLFGTTPDEKDLADDEAIKIAIRESDEAIVGAVLISQTCDVVRLGNQDELVAICPLVKRSVSEQNEIAKGRRPSLAIIGESPDGTFADLSRVMSVTKKLLITWPRSQGFSDSNEKLRFASALERKFGRFAFPDNFNTALSGFQSRVWSKHDKNSNIGNIYRSIKQIRFRATPNWNVPSRKISIIFILQDKSSMTETKDEIQSELKAQVDKIELPKGYNWANPKFVLLFLSELSAEEFLESQAADFDFLSR